MGLTIRAAAPEDIPDVARLIYLAGKSHVKHSVYDLVWPGDLKMKFRNLGRLLHADTISWYHYSHYLVAEVDGRVAGSLCGYNESESGGIKVREAFAEIGMNRDERKAMYVRMQPFYRVNPVHAADVWVVEHVAVFPEYRRRGILNTLLEEILLRGRERDYQRAELGMLIGNIPAQKAYEKADFIGAEERTDPEFEAIFSSPGMVRMVTML